MRLPLPLNQEILVELTLEHNYGQSLVVLGNLFPDNKIQVPSTLQYQQAWSISSVLTLSINIQGCLIKMQLQLFLS